jgi:phosphoglycolate phosphatase-like HAD superfamily hydrolase
MLYRPETTSLLFDLDGTLLDPGDKVALDLQATFERLGTNLSIEEARDALKDWESTAERFGYTREQFWQAFDFSREPWSESLKEGRASLYEDTLPVLDDLVLHGYTRLGLITRSNLEDTVVKIAHFGLDKYFQTIQITPTKKKEFPNKTLSVIEALVELQPPAGSDIIFVGDSEQDDIGTVYSLSEEIPHLKGAYVNRTKTPLKEYPADYEIAKLTELMSILRGEHHGTAS